MTEHILPKWRDQAAFVTQAATYLTPPAIYAVTPAKGCKPTPGSILPQPFFKLIILVIYHAFLTDELQKIHLGGRFRPFFFIFFLIQSGI